MFTCKTGMVRVVVRFGFTDYDTYGSDNLACAVGGIIDAPDYMPQGSVKCFNSAKPHPEMSIAHRDGENRPVGACHDL